MSPLLPGPENWIPIVALLWLASGGLLAFALLKYFASTAAGRTQGESIAMRPRATDLASPTRVFECEALRDAGVDEPQSPAETHAAPPTASSGDRRVDAGVMNRPASTFDAAPSVRSFETDAASLHEAVRARVARDRTSAQGLSELIRALYLEHSHFTFHTLAGLETEDRALARALIDAWLKEPSAIDAWKAIYDTVREDARSPVASKAPG